MSGGMAFCRACGGTLHSSAPLCPHCGAPQVALGGGDGIARTFGTSISICFSKYATFAGRAPRAEMWWFELFNILVHIGLVIAAAGFDSASLSIVSGVFGLATLLPMISVNVRRLHDINRSGWWYWIILVPVVGVILLLVWACTRGTRGPNDYGPENGQVT